MNAPLVASTACTGQQVLEEIGRMIEQRYTHAELVMHLPGGVAARVLVHIRYVEEPAPRVLVAKA